MTQAAGHAEWGPLVHPKALALALQQAAPPLTIIDIRLAADGGRAAYEAGHVPGAIFTDYAADGWRARVGDAPGLLPGAGHLSALFAKLGIAAGRQAVLVPAGTNANDLAAATRIYWTLKIAGHDSVSILDGGWLGWVADPARPVETGWRAPVPLPPSPVTFRDGLRATAAAIAAALADKSAAFIDARSTSYFEGREKAAEAARAGRIPGALSRDYAQLFDPARHGLRPQAEISAVFEAVPDGPVVSYCNTGHTASLNWFVLSELLGRKDVRLYDGSMTDWTQDSARPVATG